MQTGRRPNKAPKNMYDTASGAQPTTYVIKIITDGLTKHNGNGCLHKKEPAVAGGMEESKRII